MKMTSKKLYEKSALVRCTEKELKQLHQRAEVSGLSLSRFLIKSALSDGKVPTAEEKEEIKQLRFEIRKIGVNLNQIAYQINASRRGASDPPTTSEIDEIQNLVEQILKKLLKKL
jgi:hypothetical protein